MTGKTLPANRRYKFMNEFLFNAVMGIVTILISVITYSLRDWLNKKGGLTAVRIVEILASQAVQATEQIYKDKDIHGKIKFQHAKNIFLQELAQQGLTVSDTQVNNVIEASVKAMNDGWNRNGK